jgi:hypothetical protein
MEATRGEGPARVCTRAPQVCTCPADRSPSHNAQTPAAKAIPSWHLQAGLYILRAPSKEVAMPQATNARSVGSLPHPAAPRDGRLPNP